MPNVTMAMDEELLAAARDFAKVEGTTLNALMRKLVQTAIADKRRREESRARILKMMDESTGRLPPNYKFNRESLYDSPSLSRFQHTRLRNSGETNTSD